MKKIMVSLFLCSLLIGGCSTNYRLEGVQKEFPNCEVIFTPNHNQGEFLVRKPDGSVWYIKCDNPFTNTTTSRSMIFIPNKKD